VPHILSCHATPISVLRSSPSPAVLQSSTSGDHASHQR